uniref:Uncharacterized protein n=1 Tax=Anopheles coluzzii TaxID=1518534 RepID=A0A8W7P1Q7_ANOCL
MMPSDQMSTFLPYCLRVTTSGAIQYGVPTIVCRFSSPSMLAQKPKSVTFTEPSMPSSTLSDLMSRWMMPFACRKLTASSTSRQTAAIWRSFITVSVTTSVSGPPSMYSSMTHSWSTSSSCGFGGRVILFLGSGGGGTCGTASLSSLLPASESSLLCVLFWSRNWSIDSVSSWIASSVMNGLNGSDASFFLIE